MRQYPAWKDVGAAGEGRIQSSSTDMGTGERLDDSRMVEKLDKCKLGDVSGAVEPEIMEKYDQILGDDEINEGESGEDTELTEEEKEKMKEISGWSDEIIDAIDSWEEFEIYLKAGLSEAVIDNRICLVKSIDMDYIDPKTGLTNRERMQMGRAPIDSKTGERIELHHIGQDFDSPLAELCENSEHGDGNDKILHDKKIESWRQNPELKNEYNNVERPEHWRSRAREV